MLGGPKISLLLHRLAPPPGHSCLQHIVEVWEEPNSNGAFEFEWREDFSRDIVPKNCHSHNDYWRSVPLYAALAAGCPFLGILENQNVTTAAEEDKTTGIFEMDPTAATVLLIDMKTNGSATWLVLQLHLAPFREKGCAPLRLRTPIQHSNSYYASSALEVAVGKLWFKTLSPSQVDTIKEQVRAADAKGLAC
ncbi:hypothetical protein BDW02DRAFT_593039 [Decorospora gaudefroyi]|uniref:Uncharacterized protein n=1 Tax=Decorospora gaudefroyi TaxID=184978 RepID=A0A6A5K2T4_9PLEO|nr:hypothetical protein BDW02DRAFT_593039 [Decorospora gaudefroyi]